LPHVAVALSCLALVGWLYLAFFHGRFWQLLLDGHDTEPASWPSIDIIVPARNESDSLPKTLPSLLAQDYPGMWSIILVDDHSDDSTGDLARTLAERQSGIGRLTVVLPPELADGWVGKVAAMNAGVAHSQADYILFTDADIEHPVDSLRRLAARALARDLDLTSRMARLRCDSFAERLLVPAFVFFFAMLYPFRRANDPRSRIAAAAGGIMLVRRRALDAIGGLARIKSALIDDCALVKAIKESRGKIELTLTDDIRSLREYPRFADIHQTVARTAYTQLRYSPLMLVGTCLGMALLFLLPPLSLLSGFPLAAGIGFAAWLIMVWIYLPMVRFYKQPAGWALSLPVAAAIYIVATIDSARLHWQGKGGQWKGRAQG
jgi:hopene-associated glycosyltransferase HpnB